MYVPGHNVTDAAVVIDFEGRTLDAGAWGPIDPLDSIAGVAIAEGLISVAEFDPSARGVAQEAVDAHDAAALIERRRKRLVHLGIGDLRALATLLELDGPDADYATAYPATLVPRLARRTDLDLDLVDEPPPVDETDSSTVPPAAAAAP